MRILNLTNDDTIQKACYLLIRHCTDDEFLRMIGNMPFFNHTDMTPLQVSHEMEALQDLRVVISPWKPFWIWTKAIARADYKNSIIHVNMRINGSVQDRVETLMHEALHLIGFVHDGNYISQYNLSSVPYLGATIFIKHLKNIGVLE